MCTLTKPIDLILVLFAVCLFGQPAYAKYSGGTGEPNDPYQIATAADLIALGETPEDYDKHFILTADIDLDPNLPGRKVFDKAVIAPTAYPCVNCEQFSFFKGVLDGNGHKISHLTIQGVGNLGLFGNLTGKVRDLGVVDVIVTGSRDSVGALVGSNGTLWTRGGTVTQCYSSGAVSGVSYVGGLVGYSHGQVTQCYSTTSVEGGSMVGGLVGYNDGHWEGTVTRCYSTGAVSGAQVVGGLVGENRGSITTSYSTGIVSGTSDVGGLVGRSGWWSGGGYVAASFWDTQTSGQRVSFGGTGRTTAQMQMSSTFLGWGICAPLSWTISEGKDYPHLAWEGVPGELIAASTYDYGGGTGAANDPYLIYTAEHLCSIGLAPCNWDKHFKLMADVDLSGFDGKDGRPAFNIIGSGTMQCNMDYCDPVGIPFAGVFDGGGHAISSFRVTADLPSGYCGLFGYVADPNAQIKDLRLVDPNVRAAGGSVGCLVGCLEAGTITRCSVDGARVEGSEAGALIGGTWWKGTVTQCHSTGVVRGECVGGLVGRNGGTVTQCYSDCAVSGNGFAGGLVGSNADEWRGGSGTVMDCYSAGVVSGTGVVAGLVGSTGWEDGGSVTRCYSAATVSGGSRVGGLVAESGGEVAHCFWDTQTSGQPTSASGTGKNTAEMQTLATFLDAGWDFVGETANGTEDIWWILEGKDYPRLWWEAAGQ